MTSSCRIFQPLFEVSTVEARPAGVDQLEEQPGPVRNREIADLVHDQQGGVLRPDEPARGVGVLEGIDEIGQRPEVILRPLSSCLHSPCAPGELGSESICSRRIEGWKLKSKSARVFSPGSENGALSIPSPGRRLLLADGSLVGVPRIPFATLTLGAVRALCTGVGASEGPGLGTTGRYGCGARGASSGRSRAKRFDPLPERPVDPFRAIAAPAR